MAEQGVAGEAARSNVEEDASQGQPKGRRRRRRRKKSMQEVGGCERGEGGDEEECQRQDQSGRGGDFPDKRVAELACRIVRPESRYTALAQIGSMSDDQRRYLINKWAEANKHFGEKVWEQMAVAYLISNADMFARGALGSRILQAALETEREVRENLPEVLTPSCVQLCMSPHANHVLSKLFEVMPVMSSGSQPAEASPAASSAASLSAGSLAAMSPASRRRASQGRMQEMIQRLVAASVQLAADQYACRVVQRMIEHCSKEDLQRLCGHLLPNICELSKNHYGNYVVQHLLEHGSAEVQVSIVTALRGSLLDLAMDEHGSYVVQKALTFVREEACKRELQTELGPHHDTLKKSLKGSFVRKALHKSH